MENLSRSHAWNTLIHYFPERGLQWRLASERFRNLAGYCGKFEGDDSTPFTNAYERKKILGLVSLADPEFYKAWFGFDSYQSHFAPAIALYSKHMRRLEKEKHEAFESDLAKKITDMKASFKLKENEIITTMSQRIAEIHEGINIHFEGMKIEMNR